MAFNKRIRNHTKKQEKKSERHKTPSEPDSASKQNAENQNTTIEIQNAIDGLISGLDMTPRQSIRELEDRIETFQLKREKNERKKKAEHSRTVGLF